MGLVCSIRGVQDSVLGVCRGIPPSSQLPREGSGLKASENKKSYNPRPMPPLVPRSVPLYLTRDFFYSEGHPRKCCVTLRPEYFVLKLGQLSLLK